MSETSTAADQPAAAVDPPTDPGPMWVRVELDCSYAQSHLPYFSVRWDQECGPGADVSLLRILLLTLATIPNNVRWRTGPESDQR